MQRLELFHRCLQAMCKKVASGGCRPHLCECETSNGLKKLSAKIRHVNVGVLLKEMVMDCKWLSRVCYIISYQL